jgi:integrase
MQHAVENGLCKLNPVKKSIRLPKIERADKTAYTQEQYDIAYKFAKNYPDGLSITLLLETGISRSELLGLTWDDFDPERGIIHIRQGLVAYKNADGHCVTESDGLKNEYRRRSIPIVEPELLKRLREKPRQIAYTVANEKVTVDTTHIFHSPEGKPHQPNNWNNRVFLRYMNALVKAHPEIPKLSAHELRHTRATLWIAQGVSPMMVARLLGHNDLKMLMRIYDHTDVETLRDAITSATKK